MKKCPFCAEQIQDEAIVCRYCGRDLKPPEPPVELGQKATEPKPVQKSIWMSARPAAIVIAILYALNVFATTPNKGELIGDLTLGLAVTFFVWWAICAFIIWLWRSMGAAVFILLGIVTLLVVLAWSNNQTAFEPAPSPTTTRFPTNTPRPTNTHRPANLTRRSTSTPTPQRACYEADEITVAMDEQEEEICVYGEVVRYDENWEYQLTYFYFADTDFFLVSTYRWDSSVQGECIAAEGYVDLNTYGTPYMKVYDIYTCEY